MTNTQPAADLESEVRDALRRYDLSDPTEIRLLTFSENAVFKVDFADRVPVVVRLHRLDAHREVAISSELQWQQALTRDTAIRTAAVVPSTTGDLVVRTSAAGSPSRFAVVFDWLPGQAPDHSGDAHLTDSFAVLGRTTAIMHNHARTWIQPPGFHRLRWDLRGSLGATPNWGPWEQGPGLDPEGVAVLTSAAALATTRLVAFGETSARFGLIHADLRLANLLMVDDLVQVIDFDDCGFGWFLYDLASSLTFVEDAPEVPALIQSWLDGYRQVHELSDEELREIPTFLLLRRLMILAWLGSRTETEYVRSHGPVYAKRACEFAELYLRMMSGPAGSSSRQIPWT